MLKTNLTADQPCTKVDQENNKQYHYKLAWSVNQPCTKGDQDSNKEHWNDENAAGLRPVGSGEQ